MVDRRFFAYAGAASLQDIVALTGAKPECTTDAPDFSRSFSDVAPLDVAGEGDISFFDNVKYLDAFTQTKAGACFVKPKFASRAPAGMVALVTDEPYYFYALTAQRFYPQPKTAPAISPHAHIAPTAKIGKDVRIDAGVVIGEHVSIGDGCYIGANTVISDHVEIGDACRIGALCSISHAILGKRVVFHRGVHVGQDGFGFAPSKRGVLSVPQLGRVLIADEVELGSSTCVDRGAGPDTVIGQGTKIDNLVQIGHNVRIGKYTFIAGLAGLAGSCKVGDFAMIGGQVGVAGHITLGDGAKVIAQSGVIHDMPAGSTYGGSPALPAREFHRQTMTLSKLSKKDDE